MLRLLLEHTEPFTRNHLDHTINYPGSFRAHAAGRSGWLSQCVGQPQIIKALTSAAPLYNIFVMNVSGYRQATSSRLDMTFAALANPTRRAILARLASGELSVNELAEPFSMTQPAVSRHLKVLERAGLISSGSDAQRRPRKLEARPLAEATKWLERYREYWEASFVRLDGLLGELKATEKKRKRAALKKRQRSFHVIPRQL